MAKEQCMSRRSLVSVSALAIAALASGLSASAKADIVQVQITGSVGQNRFINGVLLGVPSGSPVVITFNLDSNIFLDSPFLPGKTRGYTIDTASWNMTVGGVSTPLVSPFPGGQTPRFCLRNNDPRADGFFLSVGTDLDTPLALNLGLANNIFGIAFLRTFGAIPPSPSTTPDNTLFSLDILDALCERGFQNLSSYNFTIEQSENNVPVFMSYETISIRNLTPGCPQLVSQPVSTSSCAGGNVSFSTSVSTALSGMTFTWYRGPTPIDLSNARYQVVTSPDGLTSTLTILGAAPGDANTAQRLAQGLDGYRCLITSTCGTISTELGGLGVCRADFNCSNTVTVQDIFDFLAGWFSNSPSADINGAGGITVQDIFDFLTLWFASC
jgi:hypothetical protein